MPAPSVLVRERATCSRLFRELKSFLLAHARCRRPAAGAYEVAHSLPRYDVTSAHGNVVNETSRSRCDPRLGREAMIKFLLWLLLLAVCWPLALIALVLWPIAWLLLLPFRLIGVVVDGVFELLRAIALLPARLLGGGRARA